MKFRKLGQVVLVAVVGIGLSLGLTSCVQSHTVGYLFVTGHQYNQIGAYKIDNNTGNLTTVAKSPFASGGTNPVHAIVTAGGRFLYVLNAGCADPTVFPNAKFPCASGEAPTNSNISLFTIGGGGVLTFQQSYPSIGQNSVTIATDSGGSFLYVLDQNTPSNSTTPPQYLNVGDVSVFTIDANTGRLSLVQNQQVKDVNGNALNFFPVGMDPVWFALSGQYLFTLDRAQGQTPKATYVSVYSAPTTGQLVATQNSEFPTGGTDIDYAFTGATKFFIIDRGDPTQVSNPALYNGSILIYSIGTGGALSAVTGGAQTQASLGYTSAVNPVVGVVESTNKFVYIANAGLNTGLNSAASSLSAYNINTTNYNLTPINGVLNGSINSGSNSGPRCILEDPSNQFMFTANYNDSTIAGYVLNPQAGALTLQRGRPSTAGPGNPTWCVASGTTF